MNHPGTSPELIPVQELIKPADLCTSARRRKRRGRRRMRRRRKNNNNNYGVNKRRQWANDGAGGGRRANLCRSCMNLDVVVFLIYISMYEPGWNNERKQTNKLIWRLGNAPGLHLVCIYIAWRSGDVDTTAVTRTTKSLFFFISTSKCGERGWKCNANVSRDNSMIPNDSWSPRLILGFFLKRKSNVGPFEL